MCILKCSSKIKIISLYAVSLKVVIENNSVVNIEADSKKSEDSVKEKQKRRRKIFCSIKNNAYLCNPFRHGRRKSVIRGNGGFV